MTDLIKLTLTVQALVALSYLFFISTAYSAEVGGTFVANYQRLLKRDSGVHAMGLVSSNRRPVLQTCTRNSRTEAQR